jgi:hypothetical protein
LIKKLNCDYFLQTHSDFPLYLFLPFSLSPFLPFSRLSSLFQQNAMSTNSFGDLASDSDHDEDVTVAVTSADEPEVNLGASTVQEDSDAWRQIERERKIRKLQKSARIVAKKTLKAEAKQRHADWLEKKKLWEERQATTTPPQDETAMTAEELEKLAQLEHKRNEEIQARRAEKHALREEMRTILRDGFKQALEIEEQRKTNLRDRIRTDPDLTGSLQREFVAVSSLVQQLQNDLSRTLTATELDNAIQWRREQEACAHDDENDCAENDCAENNCDTTEIRADGWE